MTQTLAGGSAICYVLHSEAPCVFGMTKNHAVVAELVDAQR